MMGSFGANEFEVDVSWKEKQVDWETKWKMTMRGWGNGNLVERSEERRRADLFDIWHLANSKR
jgi:hypothetical protein